MKKIVFTSAFLFIIFFLMLVGTTYAWWSETITVDDNIIKMGNIDLTVEFANPKDLRTDPTKWYDLQEYTTTGIFETSKKVEPGSYDVRFVKITNEGTIPLAYRLINDVDEDNQIKDYIYFTVQSMDANEIIWEGRAEDLTSNYVILKAGDFHTYKISYIVDFELGNEDGSRGEWLTLPFIFTIEAEQVGKISNN